MASRINIFALTLLVSSCYRGVSAGEVAQDTDAEAEADTGDTESAADSGSPLPENPAALGPSPLRRLTLAEYRATVQDLIGVDVGAQLGVLPSDPRTPFDNDTAEQFASAGLIEGLRLVASHAAESVVADVALRAQVVGCEPSGTEDSACLRKFVERFLFRAFRRPISEDEVDRYMQASQIAVEQGDFYAGISVIIAAALQDPSMLYRVEVGIPVEGEPDLFALNGWELATRLSYLLVGSMPDDALLEAAQSGVLDTTEGLEAEAMRLVNSSKGRARVHRFHAMWLGYEALPHSEDLAEAMRGETQALLDETIYERQEPWLELLTSPRTWLTPELAAHYGLPVPDSPGWVDYPAQGRGGILSHGSVLSNGSRFGDTSPVQRGLFVQRRLLCQEIPTPDVPDVDTDAPPPGQGEGTCKIARYEAHRTDPTCAACHELLDPIGFGLEAYDATGRWREHEPERPDCPIDGKGSLTGVGEFSGPKELGQALQTSDLFTACLLRQTYRFAAGRDKTASEDTLLDGFSAQAESEGWRFDRLLIAFVLSPSFRYRLEGAQP